LILVKWLNDALRPLDAAVVRASEYRRRYSSEIPAEPAQPLRLPPGAEAVLDAANPRLLDLQRRYRALDTHPARAASLWDKEFIDRIVLPRFRGDDAYLLQGAYTPLQRLLWLTVGYYARSIDKLGLFDRLEEDGLFGAYCFRFMDRYTGSKDLVDSVGEINFLEEAIGISQRAALRVLDIGAGYGRLMHRLVTAFPTVVSGYCTDAIPESTFLSEYYLGLRQVTDRITVVPLDQVEQTLGADAGPIDLVTNVHSFSECTGAAIAWWLDRAVAVRARYLFVVPNPYHNGGTQLISREADGSFRDFLPLIEQRGFRLAHRAPKYRDESLHPFGINTFYYLFERT
jgi:hypothetical protein